MGIAFDLSETTRKNSKLTVFAFAAALGLGLAHATHAVACSSDLECSDGNACNGEEVCSQGVCQPGIAINCDDANVCTDDTCDPGTGICTNVPVVGRSCGDGNACNGNEACNQAGVCQAGIAISCDDANICTDDACDPGTGACSNVPAAAGRSCSDGNACNGSEACDGAGVCQPGIAISCDDANICTDDVCDPGTGVCTNFPAAGRSCSDGNVCNGDEACDQNGVCSPGIALSCDDADDCTIDECNQFNGCSNTPIVSPQCSEPPPGVPGVDPNKCLAGKNKCVRKKMSALLKCRALCEKSPKRCGQAQLDCEAKAKRKFDGGDRPERSCFAKVEARQNPARPDTICTKLGDAAGDGSAGGCPSGSAHRRARGRVLVGRFLFCPDQSFVERDPADGCDFLRLPRPSARRICWTAGTTSPSPATPGTGATSAACPPHCTSDMLVCPDGTVLERSRLLLCAFPPCPTDP